MSTNISLTPEIEKYVKGLVASGFYSSTSEFFRSAARLHRKYEKLYLRELHQELSLAAEQVDNGQTEPHDMQDIIDKVNAQRSRNK